MKQLAMPILIEGLNPDVWARWMEYRKAIRKTFKPISIPSAQRRLAAFGDDQAAVVEQSIANGWTGLFPLKIKATGRKSVGDYRANLEQKIADAEREDNRVIQLD